MALKLHRAFHSQGFSRFPKIRNRKKIRKSLIKSAITYIELNQSSETNVSKLILNCKIDVIANGRLSSLLIIPPFIFRNAKGEEGELDNGVPSEEKGEQNEWGRGKRMDR